MADVRRRGGQRARVQGGEPRRRQRRHRVHPRSLHRPAVRRTVRGPAHAGRRRIRSPTSPRSRPACARRTRSAASSPRSRSATPRTACTTTPSSSPRRASREPPRTVEQAIALAEKLTFKRADGVQVYGLVMNFDDPATPIDWIRGFGGDFITPDYKVVIDQPAAVRGVTVLCDLYKKGVLPEELDEPQDRGRHDVHAAGPRRDDQQSVQPLRQLQRRQGAQVPGQDRGGRAAARRGRQADAREDVGVGDGDSAQRDATRKARGA